MAEFVYDLPDRDYRRLAGYSATTIGFFAESMAKGKAYMDGQIRLTSAAMELGIDIHRMMESRERFYAEHQLRPDGIDGRTGPGRDQLKELKANGKKIHTQDEWDQIHAIAQSYLDSDDRMIKILRDSPGHNEVSIFWEDETGLPMKGRLDRIVTPSQDDCEWLHNEYPDLFPLPFDIKIALDYKTKGGDIDRQSFYWQAKKLKYGLKATHYMAGCDCDAFVWVVLDTKPPYEVVWYIMDELHCPDEYRALVNRIAECHYANHWPGIQLTNEEHRL